MFEPIDDTVVVTAGQLQSTLFTLTRAAAIASRGTRSHLGSAAGAAALRLDKGRHRMVFVSEGSFWFGTDDPEF